jgi:hypothetical protein
MMAFMIHLHGAREWLLRPSSWRIWLAATIQNAAVANFRRRPTAFTNWIFTSMPHSDAIPVTGGFLSLRRPMWVTAATA